MLYCTSCQEVVPRHHQQQGMVTHTREFDCIYLLFTTCCATATHLIRVLKLVCLLEGFHITFPQKVSTESCHKRFPPKRPESVSTERFQLCSCQGERGHLHVKCPTRWSRTCVAITHWKSIRHAAKSRSHKLGNHMHKFGLYLLRQATRGASPSVASKPKCAHEQLVKTSLSPHATTKVVKHREGHTPHYVLMIGTVIRH